MTADELARTWSAPLYAYAHRIVRHHADAEDLAQEILLMVCRHLDRYDTSRPLEPWLYTIATNVVYRHLRDGRLHRERETEAGEQRAARADRSMSDPADEAARAEQARLLHESLAALAAEERILLVTRFVHGQSLRTIASGAELAKSTVQSRVDRALDSLRVVLRQAGLRALADGDALTDALHDLPWPDAPPELPEHTLRQLGRSGRVRRRQAARIAAGVLLGVLIGGGGIALLDRGPDPTTSATQPPPTEKETPMSEGATVPRLSSMVLAARDVAASARFYEAAFDADLTEASLGGMPMFDGTLAGIRLRILPADLIGITAEQNRHQLGFTVPDVRAAIERGLAAGGTVDEGWAVTTQDGREAGAIRDPDGNSIEMSGPASR